MQPIGSSSNLITHEKVTIISLVKILSPPFEAELQAHWDSPFIVKPNMVGLCHLWFQFSRTFAF